MNKDLRRIIKIASESSPAASASEVAGIILSNHRPLIEAWLTAQIESEKRRRTGESPQRKGKRRTDPRQTWLPLPEFPHIPVTVQADSLEEYRERMAKLEASIKSNTLRSVEKLKADRLILREMRALETKVGPFFAGNPEMIIGQAIELYRQSVASAVSKRSQAANKARWSRTKNQ